MSYFVNSLSARISRVLLLVGMIFPSALCAQTLVIPGVSLTDGNISSVAGSHVRGTTPIPIAATSGKLAGPSGVTFDKTGNMYIADASNSKSAGSFVYKVDATTGILSLIAGNTSGVIPTAPNGSAAVGSWMSGASSVAFDSAGNLFIAASYDSVIDEIPAGTTQLQIYAGQFGVIGNIGDGGPASGATLGHPISIAFDKNDNLYVADSTNHSIRMITAGGGNISTIAGLTSCTTEANCGDGGPASSASMNTPVGVTVDNNRNIFVVDRGNIASLRVIYNGGAQVACLIALENPSQFSLGGATSCAGATPPQPTTMPTVGNIYALTGVGGCTKAPCGVGGMASGLSVYQPGGGIALDGAGNIFLNDAFLILVVKIDAQTGIASSVVGSITANPNFTACTTTNYTTCSGDNGPATAAKMAYPVTNTGINGVALDTFGNLFFADTGDFNIRAVAGIAAIALTPQTITFNQSLPNVTYGAGPITLAATSTNTNLPITYSLSSTSPATISGTTLTITGAGTVDVTANQAGDTTHSAAAPVTQSFTVNKATITVTGSIISQPQGTALPSSLYTITGLVGSDTTTGTPNVTTTYLITSPIGQYPITVGQGSLAVSPPADAPNYQFAFVNGNITVGGGTTQTITFPSLPATITYGDAPIMLKATSDSGLPITYTATGSALVTGSAASGWTLSILSAGQGTVTATQAGNTQFAAATPQSQVFSVKPASLTVTATSFSQAYGTAVPSPLPFTVAGLIGSDSVGGTTPTLTTAYTTTDPVGTVDQIAISQGTLTVISPGLTGNYTVHLVPGTITVTVGANVITGLAVPPGNQTYGSVVTLNAKASSGLPVTYSVTTGNATITNGNTLTITGLGLITISATQSGNANYAPATSVTTTFTATQATLLVTVGYYTRSQGALNPVFTAAISGFVNGDANTPLVLTGAPIITTLATPDSPPGTYAVTPALGTLFSNNYKFSFIPGQLVVSQTPSYIVTATPNALTIPIGKAGQATLLVQSVNSYQGTVTFGCGQVPIGLTCTFSPATVNVVYNAQNTSQSNISTLTVTATGPSAQLRTGGTNTVMAGLFLMPGGLAGLLLAFQRKRIVKNVRLRQLLVLIVLLSGVMGMGACGSSNNLGQAPMGNTTLLITATGTGTPNTGSQNVTNILYLTVNVVPLQQ